MKRVAIYARFSSDLQDETSIEDQIRVCTDYAKKQPDWLIVERYTDYALSGTTMRRAGIQSLLRDAKLGKFDVVVAEALDRISRDMGDVAHFHRALDFRDIQIWTLSEGLVDIMHVAFKGLMSQKFIEDLRAKVLRGQRGAVERGKITAGLAYGYAVVRRFGEDGKPVAGEREIVPDQAAVVRRIFEEYAAGKSPLAICRGLEADGIPTARGGRVWNVSTLNGNKGKQFGILNCENYRGKIVWNRTQDTFDPDTHKRIVRVKSEEEWVLKDAENLRIVSDELWGRVKARQAALALKSKSWDKRRPKHLLSGLIRCGTCGSPFVKLGHERYACTQRNPDTSCTHKLAIKRDVLEGAVVKALQERLMDERLVKVFCEEYTRHMNTLRIEKNATIAGYQTELAKLERKSKKMVEAIADGAPSKQFVEPLKAIEKRQEEIAVLLSQCEEAPVLLHPRMALHYQRQIEKLTSHLSDQRFGEHAHEPIRALVDRIVLTPNETRTALKIDLHGDLAGILNVAIENEAPKRRRRGNSDNGEIVMVGPADHGHKFVNRKRRTESRLTETVVVGRGEQIWALDFDRALAAKARAGPAKARLMDLTESLSFSVACKGFGTRRAQCERYHLTTKCSVGSAAMHAAECVMSAVRSGRGGPECA